MKIITNINEMSTKTWVKVRINKSKKVYTFTKQTFKTKSEGVESLGSSNSYQIVNKKNIQKLELEGYKNSIDLVEPTQEWQPKELEGNPTIEAQIEAYTEKKVAKDIISYAKKKAVRDARKARQQRTNDTIAIFMGSVPKPEKQQAFNYDKNWEEHYKSVKKRKQYESEVI